MRPISTSKTLSPIAYPGGKSLQAHVIRSYFPPGLTEMASPFTGGGGVELSAARAGVRVYGADAFEPLVNFWRHALEYPVRMAERVETHMPFDRTKFYAMRQGYFDVDDPFEAAVRFFILNRTSFSGTTLLGGFSELNYEEFPSYTEKLRNFQASGLSVELADYRETIAKHSERFLYLDPPYPNAKSLYGKDGKLHNQFDHTELADLLHAHDNWLMSYCDTPEIRQTYAEYELIPLRWKYAARNTKDNVHYGSELLIRNVDAPCLQPDLFPLQ